MYGKTTEDLDGSNEDLIGPQRMADNAFGYAQLELGADEVNTGHAPYAVVVNNIPSKSRIKNCQIFVVLLILVLFLLCVVFISLYVARSKDLESLKKSRVKSTACTTPGCIDAASFMQNAMDNSASPCNDFYRYSCGGWITKNPIPDQKSRWGVDSILSKQNLYALRHDLEESERTGTKIADSDDAKQKARHFYKACMNINGTKMAGSKPLLDVLRRLNAAIGKGKDKSVSSILTDKLVILARNYSVPALFSTGVGVDSRNSSRNAIIVSMKSYH